MFTYCPNCGAIFRISAGHLTRAEGAVRCGECRHTYAASDYLYDDLAAVQAALDESTAPEPEPVVETPLDYVAGMEDVAASIEQEIPASINTPRTGWEPPRSGTLLNGASILALLVLLALQWTWFNRAALAANETWRPGVEGFCEVLGCTLPLARDISRFKITSRDVRQHPTVEGALLINAVFENGADVEQQYPVFEISFTDRTGKPVAVRRFQADEYLPVVDAPAAGITAGAQVQVVLEVLDPGEQAVSFQFSFL